MLVTAIHVKVRVVRLTRTLICSEKPVRPAQDGASVVKAADMLS